MAAALVTRITRGIAVVTVVVDDDVDAAVVEAVDFFVAGVNFADLASFTLVSVVVDEFGARVVASGGYKPFIDNALPNNGFKYCTALA